MLFERQYEAQTVAKLLLFFSHPSTGVTIDLDVCSFHCLLWNKRDLG